jgi:hypothetical protein
VLTLARIGMARRTRILRQWPSLALAGIAAVFLARGALASAAIAAGLAAALWIVGPRVFTPAPKAAPPSDGDARAALGVGPAASKEEIRQAYRRKMARAHPDHGGGHDEAARLTAARDLLLKRGA